MASDDDDDFDGEENLKFMTVKISVCKAKPKKIRNKYSAF